MAPMHHVGSLLRPGEEEWLGVFERLCERFPTYTPERIAGILRENNGHAGQAAAALRDLSGTAMRPVDPDDAEHVRTLLSSPVMFGAACKEHFRKFDVNGDGVLEWTEICALTNSLYENFGLEPPREGGLKAFFEATDTNHDGVLSEREFKRFFEMFLRYAFFDIAQHERGQAMDAERAHASQDEEEEPPKPVASPQRERSAQRLAVPQERRQAREARTTAVALDLDEAPAESRSKNRRRPEGHSPTTAPVTGAGAILRCVAGHGVTYRRSAEYGDRADAMVHKGEEVQVLEQWVKTSKGWLPLLDKNGQVTFEVAQDAGLSRATSDGERKSRSHKSGSSTGASRRSKAGPSEDPEAASRRLSNSQSIPRPGSRGRIEVEEYPPAQQRHGVQNWAWQPHEAPRSAESGGQLRPEEEDWRPRWIRLQERFPQVGPEECAQALRDANGHAGQAAAILRELTQT